VNSSKFKKGDKVKVQWSGYWTKAEIIGRQKSRYIVRIRFPGSEPFEAVMEEHLIKKG
jgi:hypothetical protein